MNIYISLLKMATASQISHGALARGRVLGAVALMSPLTLCSGDSGLASQLGGDGARDPLSLWGCRSSSQLLPLQWVLLSRATLPSLLGAMQSFTPLGSSSSPSCALKLVF